MINYWVIPGLIKDAFDIEYAVKLVCTEFNVSESDVKSKKRVTDVVSAKHILFHLCRKFSLMTSAEIGKFFNVDHTTVLMGVKKVSFYVKNEPNFREIVKRIEYKTKYKTPIVKGL